jgi:hypothetical protein
MTLLAYLLLRECEPSPGPLHEEEHSGLSMPARTDREYIAGSRVSPPRFSPLRDVHPLRGCRVLPRSTSPDWESGAELVLVLRARRPGRYAARGVRLDYSVGGDQHRRLLPNAFAVCVVPPAAKLPRECALPPRALWDL